MKINFKLIHWNLRNKIILHVLVVGILAAFILSYIFITTQNNVIEILNMQKSEMVSSMIECNLTYQMLQDADEKIKAILQRLSALSNIDRVRILNLEGQILHSSHSKEEGAFLSANEKKKLTTLFSDFNQKNFFSLKPAFSSQSYLAIENKVECHTCHAPEKKTNGILEIKLDERTTQSLLRRNQLTGIIVALVALIILSYIILRLFEKIINRPLSQLKEIMKNVQEGNLDSLIQPSKNDEIGSLSHSFNTMVEKLHKANHKIDELHQQQMERASHLASMGELAAGLAHEIKNPIAGIKGALEIIKHRTNSDDPQIEIFDEILVQIDKIHNIIQDLLSYSKPKEIKKRPANPNNCIIDAIKLAQPQIQKKDIQIAFARLKDDIQIMMDEDKVQEVMLNLLLNSIAAIERKGEISIQLKIDNNNMLEITVSDDGRGIKAEHLSQVFNPFFTTRKKGTGLGLSICKKIIDAHQGSIQVTSQEEKGTTFIIQVPIRQSEQ